MSIRDVRAFKNYYDTLSGVNRKLQHFDRDNIEIGRFGRVKVTFEIERPGGKSKEISLTRNELAKYATSLAFKMKDPAKAKALLETFQRRMGRLDKKVDFALSFEDSKRVKAGRKLAGFSKHLFNRDTSVDKAIAKLNDKVHELHIMK